MEYISLYNGVKIPQLGYGVYQVKKEECKRCVLDALNVGYRHIDTAQAYFNEEEVGNAICESGIKREDIFITTKVWLEHYGFENTKKSIYVSLKKLKTNYIDLVLLHQPFNDVYSSWRALEELYLKGVIRAIGISNFYPNRMVDIASFSKIKPMVNQIEIHPFNLQLEAKKWNEKYGIKVESWGPFAEGRGDLFNNEVIKKIGLKYNKTNAQVILRWLLDRGIIVFPKTTHKERMIKNYNVFDFKLDSNDFKFIESLNKNESSFFSHQDSKTVELFVKMIEERKNK